MQSIDPSSDPATMAQHSHTVPPPNPPLPTPSIHPPQNTTPDDVHICEAYLAFLRSNGNNSEYWRVLTGALRLLCLLRCVCCIVPAALLHFARPGALQLRVLVPRCWQQTQRQKPNTEVDLCRPCCKHRRA